MLAGFRGTAIAHLISTYVQCALAFGYLKFVSSHDPRTNIDIFSKSDWMEAMTSYREVREYLRLGFAGVMSMSEWIFWETTCFLAGTLGVGELAVHTVAYNLIPLAYMIPLGFSVGITTRVGHLLGSGDVEMSKKLVTSAIALSTSISLLYSGAIWLWREAIIRCFTKDDLVVQGCLDIWPLVVCFLIIDGIFAIQEGVMKALGLQLQLALCVLCVCWCGSIPIMALAVSKASDGVQGLMDIWLIFPPTYVLLNVALTFVYSRRDWSEISRAIIAKGSGSEPGSSGGGAYSKISVDSETFVVDDLDDDEIQLNL